MSPRKQLAKIIDQIVEPETEIKIEAELDTSTVEEYKKLNRKCDVVIGKIKTRKSKKNNQQIGE